MKTLLSTIAIGALALAMALPVSAQQKRMSPHESIYARIGRGSQRDLVGITYGRPYTVKPGTTETRKIWGDLVPWGEPWRMGADEATVLMTQKPLEIGGKTIPAGAYTLYMVPQENGTSQLAFSSALGGWGIPVNTDHDVARVDLEKAELDTPVDQFTMAVTKNPKDPAGGIIKLSWEKTEFSVSFTVQK